MASGVVGSSLSRLVLAAILGGLIGLEREFKHRAAGLRTNMFICFGAAMFTVLSRGLAGVPSDARQNRRADYSRHRLHRRGLDSAHPRAHYRPDHSRHACSSSLRSEWPQAAAFTLTAMFATGLVLITLFFLGHVEETFNLKLLLSSYEVTGASVEEISNEVNRILESHHRLMQNTLTGNTGQHVRLQFDVEGCNREQKELLQQLKASTVLRGVTSLGRVERE